MDIPGVIDRVMAKLNGGIFNRALLLKIYDNIFNLYPSAFHGHYLYQAQLFDSIIYFTQRDSLDRPNYDYQHPFLLENNSQFNLRWADDNRPYWNKVKELLASPHTAFNVIRYWQENFGQLEGGLDFDRLNNKVMIQLFDIGITALIRSSDKIPRDEFATRLKRFCEFFIAPEELNKTYSPDRPVAINLLIILYQHLVSHPLAQLDRRAIVADLQQILANCTTQAGQTITHMDPAAILTDASLVYELVLRTNIVNVHLAARDFSNVLVQILGFSPQDFGQYARGMTMPFISTAIQHQETIELGTVQESAGLLNNISEDMVGHGDDWRISAKTLKTRALAMLSKHERDPKYEYGTPLYEFSSNGLTFILLKHRRNPSWRSQRWATPHKTFKVTASNLVYATQPLSIWEAEQLLDFQISKYKL